MKQYFAIGFAAVVLLAPLHSARAQEWFGSATWQISIPTGDTKDFVGETSFRGFGLDFRKMVRPGTTAGFLFGWNVFHERVGGTYELESGAVTGTQDRYINSFPIMVGVHRYFGTRGHPRPYVGVAGGGIVILRSFAIGVYGAEEDNWDWGIAPEIGVVIPTQTGAALVINGRYNWSFTHQNLLGEDEDLTYWGINVGFVWEQY